MTSAIITETQAARLLATWVPTASMLDQEIEQLLMATQPPPPPAPSVTWYGDFSSGVIDPKLFPQQSYVAGHAKVVDDPLGSKHKVLELAVNDSDRPYVGATNPRADIQGPPLFGPGVDAFITTSLLLPPGFPLVKHWFQVFELYGPPHGGSPPVGGYLFDIGGVNRLILQNRGGAPFWQGPPLDDKWHQVTLHVHFATDLSGFVEVFYDGVLVKMLNGSAKANYPNLVSGVNWDGKTPNVLDINSYREAGGFPGTVTLYHGSPTVASTLAGALSKPLP